MKTTKNDSTAEIIQREALKVHKVLCGFEELLYKTSPHPFFEFNTPIGVWEFHKENRHEALHRKDEEWKEKVQGLRMEKKKTRFVGIDYERIGENKIIDEFNKKLDELLK